MIATRHFGYGYARGYLFMRDDEEPVVGGGPVVPPGALRDRDGNYIFDRDGNYIVSGTR